MMMMRLNGKIVPWGLLVKAMHLQTGFDEVNEFLGCGKCAFT
jgi:hypothetical protein